MTALSIRLLSLAGANAKTGLVVTFIFFDQHFGAGSLLPWLKYASLVFFVQKSRKRKKREKIEKNLA